MAKNNYQSPNTVGKRQTVFIDVNDPRLKNGRYAQTLARQGAEVVVVDSTGRPVNMANLTASGNAALATIMPGNPDAFVIPPINNQPPVVYPGGSGPTVIIPTDPINVVAAWGTYAAGVWTAGSGDDLQISFTWDPTLSTNTTMSQFIVSLTAGTGSSAVTNKYTGYPIAAATTSQVIYVTKAINTYLFNIFTPQLTAICVSVADVLNNVSATVCATSVPTYVLNLNTPTINVVNAINGYVVTVTNTSEMAKGAFDAIDIWEIESTSGSAPTITYAADGYTPASYTISGTTTAWPGTAVRTYFSKINPANITSPNYNQRYVYARFSSSGGVYTTFSTPGKPATPQTLGYVNTTQPSDVVVGTPTWGGVISKTGSGSISGTSITVTSATNIVAGMSVFGTGIGSAALVASSYTPGSTTVPLTVSNYAAVSGTISFLPSTNSLNNIYIPFTLPTSNAGVRYVTTLNSANGATGKFYFYPSTSSIAITGMSGDGTYATYYTTSTVAVGSSVTISGATPSGYNGTYSVTGLVTGGFKVLNNTTTTVGTATGVTGNVIAVNQTQVISLSDLTSQFGSSNISTAYTGTLTSYSYVDVSSTGTSISIATRLNPLITTIPVGRVVPITNGYISTFDFTTTPYAIQGEVYESYTAYTTYALTNDFPDYMTASVTTASGGSNVASQNLLTVNNVLDDNGITAITDFRNYPGYLITGTGVPSNTFVSAITLLSAGTYQLTLSTYNTSTSSVVASNLTTTASGTYTFNSIVYTGGGPATIPSTFYAPRNIVVRYVDPFGYESLSSNVVNVTPSNPAVIITTAPNPPSVTSTAQALTSITIQLQTTATLTKGYFLSYGKTGTLQANMVTVNIPSINFVSGTSTTSYIIPGLSPSTSYDFIAQAYDQYNNVGVNSTTLTSSTTTQTVVTPTGLTVSAKSYSALASWDDMSLASPTTPIYIYGILLFDNSGVITKAATAGTINTFTVTFANTTGLSKGAYVSGTGIGSGAQITAINTGTGVVTLSVKNTATVTGNTISLYPLIFEQYTPGLTFTISGLVASSSYAVSVYTEDIYGVESIPTAPTIVTLNALGGSNDGVASNGLSVAPTITPMFGALQIAWPMVSNPDPVTYEVHISTTNNFTPDRNTAIVTGAAVSGANIIYTTSATHTFTAGQTISLSGISPTFGISNATVLASPAPTATTFAVLNNVSATGSIIGQYATAMAYSTTLAIQTSSTFALVKALPGATYGAATTQLVYFSAGTTPQVYYTKIVAKDFNGAAAASPQASGSTLQVANGDVAANAIAANQIQAGAVTATQVDATILNTKSFRVGSTIPYAIYIDGSGTYSNIQTAQPVNRLYSGTGVWFNNGTPFYIDTAGYFSLNDQFKFDPSTNALTATGTINATAGNFAGAMTVNNGTMKIGKGVNPINIPVSGTTAGSLDGLYINNYNQWYSNGYFSVGASGNQVVWDQNALNISGQVNANRGSFTGPLLISSTGSIIAATSYTISNVVATTTYTTYTISPAAATTFAAGQTVTVVGVYPSVFNVTSGTILASPAPSTTSFSVTSSGLSTYTYANSGTAMLTNSGGRVTIQSNNISAYDSSGNLTTQILGNVATGTGTFTTTDARIGNWIVATNSIQNQGTTGTYVGIDSRAAAPYSIWAGSTASGGDSTKFAVTPSGTLYANNAIITGGTLDVGSTTQPLKLTTSAATASGTTLTFTTTATTINGVSVSPVAGMVVYAYTAAGIPLLPAGTTVSSITATTVVLSASVSANIPTSTVIIFRPASGAHIGTDGTLYASSAYLAGPINATGGSFTGNVLISGGSLYSPQTAGTLPASGTPGLIFNPSGLYAWTSGTTSTQLLTTPSTAPDGTTPYNLYSTAAYLGGWIINASKIASVSSGGNGNISLDSSAGTISVANGSVSGYTAGIYGAATTTGTNVFWAGSGGAAGDSTTNSFRVTLGGKLYARGADITGAITVSTTGTSTGTLNTKNIITIDAAKDWISLGDAAGTAYLITRNNNVYLTAPAATTTQPWGGATPSLTDSTAPTGTPFLAMGTSASGGGFKDSYGARVNGIGIYTGAWDYFGGATTSPFITATTTGLQLSASNGVGILLEPTFSAYNPGILLYSGVDASTKQPIGPTYSGSTAYGANIYVNPSNQTIGINATKNIGLSANSTGVQITTGTTAYAQWGSTGVVISPSNGSSTYLQVDGSQILLQTTSNNNGYYVGSDGLTHPQAGTQKINMDSNGLHINGLSVYGDDSRLSSISSTYSPFTRVIQYAPQSQSSGNTQINGGDAVTGFAIYYGNHSPVGSTGTGFSGDLWVQV